MTDASAILKALKTVTLRKVAVAGIEVHVRGLTGAERRLLQDRAKDDDPVQAHELVGLVACNESGEALFTEQQAAELAHVDGAAVEEIARAILEASGLLPGAQDEAAKN